MLYCVRPLLASLATAEVVGVVTMTVFEHVLLFPSGNRYAENHLLAVSQW
jgi:hypothetical protein